jgi:hypothetical protein
LLQSEDLVELDARILPLRIGSEVTFDAQLQPTLSLPSTRISLNTKDIKVEAESVSFDKVVNAARDFGKRLKQSLLGLTFWIPELRIRVEEDRRVIRFDVNNQVFAEDHRGIDDVHIEAHSSALREWFMKPYGADSFFIGGHFAVLSKSTTPIKRVLLACSLMEKRLSPRSLARYLLRPGGIKFLLNRREEIVVTLSQRRLRVGDRVS